MIRRGPAALALVAAAAVASCHQVDNGARHWQSPANPAGPPRIDATLTLPQGDGRVHVVAIPGDLGEVTRCVVAVSSVGMIATSCSPKDIELSQLEQ